MRGEVRRVGGAAIGLAALVLGVLIPGPVTARLGAQAPCSDLVPVPTVGMACPVDGGYWVPVGDRWTFTHGGDPLPSDRRSSVLPAKPRRPECIGDLNSEFGMRVIYARAHDTKDRYNQKHDDVRDQVELANGFLYREAREVRRWTQFRVACKGKDVWVQSVELPTDMDRTTFGTVLNDLNDLGYDSVLHKYWVWFDGRPPLVSAAGTGTTFVFDATPGSDNVNNQGPSYSVTWGIDGDAGASTMLHELGHNLGAVAIAAPFSSGAGHCIDDQDVMCYRDGGPRIDNFRDTVCDRVHFDCRHNDYFAPEPTKGSWIASHWNIGSPVSRFVAGCSYKTDVLTVPMAGLDPEEAARVVTDEVPDAPRLNLTAFGASIPKACRGKSYAASGFVAPPTQVAQGAPEGLFGLAYSILPGPIRESDVDVCFYQGRELIRCDDQLGNPSGKVPAKATRARVILKLGPPSIAVFNII